MPDFTSSLYLGLRHPAAALGAYPALTLGKPAALAPPPGERAAARGLARLVGCEAALLGTSTLHLFWDLFGLLAGPRTAVFVDSEAYAVGRWGAERAAARGARVEGFRHHDAGHLASRLQTSRRRPVVLADGFCPGCGRPAPVAEYLEILRPRGGLLVLDDTQALGIQGTAPSPRAPYGTGGGGSFRLAGVAGPGVLVVASLAKAFGAPVAALAGPRRTVGRFARASATRVHSSPPSVAAVAAAVRALAINRASGDLLRARLAGRVTHFRRALAGRGLRPARTLFPVQPLEVEDPRSIHRRLAAAGLRTAVARTCRGPRLLVLVNAAHRPRQLDLLASRLAACRRRAPSIHP